MMAVALRCVVAAAVALALSACAPAGEKDRLARMQQAGVVRIGITGTSPPWTSFDAEHKPTGYDVEVAQEVARRIGVAQVTFVPDAFKNFVEGLKTDKYDLVLNDLTPTPARSEQVDFARAYGVEDFRIFVRADEISIHGVADLKGKVIGVTTGSSNERWAKAHLSSIETRGYDNGSLLFRDLFLGRIDAVLVSHFGGLKYGEANQQPLREASEPLSYQLSAPALAKEQPRLKKALDQAISAMLADGTIDRLAGRWLGVDYKMSTAIDLGEREAAGERPSAAADQLRGVIARSLPLLGPALATTLQLGATSFVLGSILGLLVALARLSEYLPLRMLAFAYLSVFRGTPLLVQLLLIYFGLPQTGFQIGPVPAAIVALTLFSAAYLSENFRAGILSVDKGQSEAALSMGMGYWLTLRRVILPQGLLTALPSTGSRLIALMKDTSLASVITVAELTRVADEVGATTFRYVEAFVMVGAIYWALNQALTLVQLGVERRLSRHLR